MKWFFGIVDRFWFAEAPPTRLAVLRILVGLFALYLEVGHYGTWVDVGNSDESLFEPVGVVAILQKPLPPSLFTGLVTACLAFNVLFVIGWRFRITAPTFAALFLWVLCYRNSWAMIYHSANLVLLHVIVLAFSPAADALSLDARRRRRSGLNHRAPVADWRYGWPIRTICAITAAAYLLSGIAKVAGPLGWSWVSGEALRSQVAADAIRKEVLGETTSTLFYSLYDRVWIFTVLAFGSLVLELGAPLVLVNARLGRLWAIASFLMHWGIFFIMGITFRYQLCGVAFASYFCLERLLPWHTPRSTAEPPLPFVGERI